jgi:hypothetical protein
LWEQKASLITQLCLHNNVGFDWNARTLVVELPPDIEINGQRNQTLSLTWRKHTAPLSVSELLSQTNVVSEANWKGHFYRGNKAWAKMAQGFAGDVPAVRDGNIIDCKITAAKQSSPDTTPTKNSAVAQDSTNNLAELVAKQLDYRMQPPFKDSIPLFHEDDAYRLVLAYISGEYSEFDLEHPLLLALPGSGKSRTVAEAANNTNDCKYIRIKLQHPEGKALREMTKESEFLQYFLEKILPSHGCTVMSREKINISHRRVLIHIDEVQLIMPASDSGVTNHKQTAIVQLAQCLESLHGMNTSIRFALSGTSYLSNRYIKLGSHLKTKLMPLSGDFPDSFVTQLANKFGLPVPNPTHSLEFRYNRRFTQYYFAELYDQVFVKQVQPEGDIVFKAAFEQWERTVTLDGVAISQAAAQTLGALLDREPAFDMCTRSEKTVVLTQLPDAVKSYILSGGLNVKSDTESGVRVYFPRGCMLTLLLNKCSLAATEHNSSQAAAFGTASRSNSFDKGHFFERLVALFLTVASSEIRRSILPAGASASLEAVGIDFDYCACIHQEAIPLTRVYCVKDEQSAPNRIVDVAFPYQRGNQVGTCYLEVKTTASDQAGELWRQCWTFFSKIRQVLQDRTATEYYHFVFLSLNEFQTAQPRQNKVKTGHSAHDSRLKVLQTLRDSTAGNISFQIVDDLNSKPAWHFLLRVYSNFATAPVDHVTRAGTVYPGGTPSSKPRQDCA